MVSVTDVLVLAAPVASRPYDPELEKRLARAAKRSAVSRLERDDAIPGQRARVMPGQRSRSSQVIGHDHFREKVTITYG